MALRFSKYEGIGNDFVVVDDEDVLARALGPHEVARICDRHLGVGADGVLLVARSGGRASMKVINADGSVPEMCGNGVRCVALHLFRIGAVTDGRVVIDTDAGPHECVVDPIGEAGASGIEEALVDVAMRIPSLIPSEVPVASDAPFVDAAFEVDGLTLRGTAVSMGNPHLVIFDAVGDRRLTLGPRLERDSRFPNGVNVGFATMEWGGITLDVWERGAGWTRACGTGACAAAVAAVEIGKASRRESIRVRLPGGELGIRVGDPGEPVHMRGPARHVFDGELSRGIVRGGS
jgi:diaminopimelate epimerase